MHLKKIGSIAAAAMLSLTLATPLAAQAQSSSSELSQAFNLSSQLSSASSSPSTNTAPSAPSTTSATRQTVSVLGQGTRSYLIDLPRNYNPSKAYPVILGYSGFDMTASHFRDFADLGTVAGNTIRIYPEATKNSQGQEAWEGPRYAATSRGQDVAFTRAIINQVKTHYNVDSRKVYATGLSNGGGMALNLACQAPDLVAAVAVVSTASYTPIFNNCSGQAIPTMFLHGTNDTTAPYYNDGSNAHGGPYYAARTAYNKIAQRNGCWGANEGLGGPGYSSFGFDACLEPVVMNRVNGGIHTWFNDSPNAENVVWDFLSQFRK